MKQPSDKGFTIVELLVTIIVGAIMMSSATLIFTTQTRLSQRGRDIVMANAYMENKVESLRSVGFLGLSDGATDISSELPSELSPPRSGTMTVSSYSPAIKQVVLSLTYNDQGAARTYTYKTYVGELGAGQY